MTPPQCWCGNAITPRSKSTRSQRKSHDLRGSFFFQAEDGIRARNVTGVQTCALPILYLSCQVKLLRVLQEEEVRRLGETRNRKVDVRIIAATNKDLKTEMECRRFREDLFHRISVLPIHLPPLRDRREDLPLLVDQFLRQFNRELGRSIRAFTPQALERLKSHAWPGNVRELENRVKQAMVMAKGDVIDVEALDLFPGGTAGTSFPSFKKAK